jgi:hypothetical protein
MRRIAGRTRAGFVSHVRVAVIWASVCATASGMGHGLGPSNPIRRRRRRVGIIGTRMSVGRGAIARATAADADAAAMSCARTLTRGRA